MYSNQALYYLQQLGITPWIRRDYVLAVKSTIIIIKPNVLSSITKTLFENILHFLTLEKIEYEIRNAKQEVCNGSIVCIFGEDSAFSGMKFPALDELIANPLQKKMLFENFKKIATNLNE